MKDPESRCGWVGFSRSQVTRFAMRFVLRERASDRHLAVCTQGVCTRARVRLHTIYRSFFILLHLLWSRRTRSPTPLRPLLGVAPLPGGRGAYPPGKLNAM